MRFLVLLLLPLGCSPLENCDFDAVVADLAHEDAASCGASGAEEDEAGWACAVAAWQEDASFVLRFTSQGSDSTLERAVVFDGHTIWLLTQDQYGGQPWDVDGYRCGNPSLKADSAGGYDVIDCRTLKPEGNHFQVCGEICAECGDPDPLPFPG
jgi:hypothetical protein